MRNARYRSNPYEAINNRFFQNRYLFLHILFKKNRFFIINFSNKYRAAMKMANLDAVFDFMFTDPKNADGVSKLFF